tara:strand:+ start:558 stop:812 length:255 start_codon:yes stop_codon:yes gene_type:complete
MPALDLYQALMAHYESQKRESLAILKLYFSRPVGIGDHSNLLDDMKEWTSKLSEAEECIKVLGAHFIINPEQKSPQVMTENKIS